MSLFLAFLLFFSINAIQASDVHADDSPNLESSDDASFQLGNDSEYNQLGATNSDNLSTSDDCIPLKENSKNQTELISLATSVYMSGEYNVILKDLNTKNNLPNKNVTFLINNVNYTTSTDGNGVAKVNLNLNPGTYTVMAYFTGDNDYEVSNLTSKVNV